MSMAGVVVSVLMRSSSSGGPAGAAACPFEARGAGARVASGDPLVPRPGEPSALASEGADGPGGRAAHPRCAGLRCAGGSERRARPQRRRRHRQECAARPRRGASPPGSGSCAASAPRTSASLPFAGLARVLQPLLPAIDDLPEPQAYALGVALALRAEGVADRFAVSAAALTLVTRAAESGPVALVVDDAHLLDTSSAQALAFVARRVLVDSVLVLAATRPGESDAWSDLPTLHLQPIASAAAEPSRTTRRRRV